MPVKNFDWIGTLEENPEDVYLDSTSILLKLMDNVIHNPSNPKFRSIRLNNPTVSKKLMPAIGALECLFEIGFEEDDDKLTLPENISLEHLKKVREEINLRRNSYLNSNSGQSQHTVPSGNSGMVVDRTQNEEPSVENSQIMEVQTSEPIVGSGQGHQNINQENPIPVVTNVNENLNPPTQIESTDRLVTTVSTSVSNDSGNSRRVPELSLTQLTVPQNTTQPSEFLQSVQNHSYAVLQYEDKALQKKAEELIPIKKLEAAVEAKMHDFRKSLKQSSGGREQDVDVKELLLLELLDWFKNSFFSWVDAPNCNHCSGKTTFVGVSKVPEELTETKRVEVYICKQCKGRTLFPRHHNPYRLLETRKGRCGEWANCFTLFCRTLGWDARHVVDQTDHVWTEVYSMSQGRWLHCDPCENICDQPLIYERGWGKKLTYVMAYSCDDVQDVTWRYTAEHRDILSRRTLCSEEELLRTLSQIRQDRQRNVSATRRAFLTRRLLTELIEFLIPPKPSEADFQGRSSGSLAWRLARRETGVPKSITSHVWEPSPSEILSCSMQIDYSAAQNKYIRVSTNEEVKGWENGVYEANSVFRKEEKDWNKVYLARGEGSDKGSVKWKIDCSKSGLIVETVSVKCAGTTFESGKNILTLCNDEFCVPVPSGNSIFKTSALKGSQKFFLNAELTGGKGNVAWQHAQLFRQDLDDTSEFPFSILVKFKKI